MIELKQNRRNTLSPELGYGLVISLGNDEFFVAGKGFQVTFFPDTENPKYAGIASLYEGEFVDDEWMPGRKLNGDAIMLNYFLDDEAANNKTGSVVRIQRDEPQILKVKLYQYE